MNFINRLADRFAKVQPLPVGVYHKQDIQDNKPYRVHLRLRPDGAGILILNASTVLQLNATAAEYAYHFIHGTDPEEAVRQIASRYRVSKDVARQDYQDFIDKLETLISTPDLDPVSYLDFERAAPHSADLLAPLRLDCALTYRLREDSDAEYAPTKRVDHELTTDEWRLILDKAWQAGIPHITFTGGEATLRDDLPDLIAHAEKNGQVCGLLTDGLRLIDKNYFDLLLQTGLDHILFLLQPDNEKSWLALENATLELARKKALAKPASASGLAAPASEPKPFHFRVELDKRRQVHVECRSGHEPVASIGLSVAGFNSLFNQGLMRKPTVRTR